MTRMFELPAPDEGGEPERDDRLAALLRDACGEPALNERDWRRLADRIGAAVRAQHGAPWWSHVAGWQLRALPLALAAGLVGALALWSAAGGREPSPGYYAADAIIAVVSGDSSAEAAGSYAGFVTTTVDLSAGIPE